MLNVGNWQVDQLTEGHMKSTIMMIAGLLAGSFLLAGAAQAVLPADAKCQALKNKEAGKYTFCLAKAEMKLVKAKGACSGDGTTACYRDMDCVSLSLGTCTKDTARYDVLVGKCNDKFSTNWGNWEANAGGDCPTTADQSDMQTAVANFAECLAEDLDGAAETCDIRTVQTDLDACNEDLTTCQAEPPSQPLKTGQSVSYVAGDDGAVQKGQGRSYTDNGDGTITDNKTGLMWEKKIKKDTLRDGANLNDADNLYPWAGDCSSETECFNGGKCCQSSSDCTASPECVITDAQGTGLTIWSWVARMNNRCADQITDCTAAGDAACAGIGNEKCGFAGYRDWRIPNVNELQSIVSYGTFNPSVSAAFEGASCGGACTDITSAACSCTGEAATWSSSTFQTGFTPYLAWLVAFSSGDVTFSTGNTGNKDIGMYVRAVRGGRG
jgi:hypothetical protein